MKNDLVNKHNNKLKENDAKHGKEYIRDEGNVPALWKGNQRAYGKLVRFWQLSLHLWM